ncbi:hypothetical protein [Egicoccus sp. AB-alg6-2]|uniref:hypothetical protein n=1 Tax=Egicoccus sp. AB-alg6-2 TaxID=3242692 RepID=UPI00359EE2FF
MTSGARLHRSARLLAVVLALVAGTAAGVAPAAADECDGVWVVIDAQRLGADVRTLCAPGSPANGLEALRLAGVSYAFVERQPGLVCTLNGRPDPCNGAPSDAYWSYWHAEAGGSWTYSTRGAGNRTPPRGSVEGWSFGAGEPPARKPPAASAPTAPAPSPSPTATPTAGVGPSPTPTAAPSPSPTSSSSGSETTTPAADKPAESSATPDGATSSAPDSAAEEPGDDQKPDGADPDAAEPDADEAVEARPERSEASDVEDTEDAADASPAADGADAEPATDADGRRRDIAEDDMVALGETPPGGRAPLGAIGGGALVATLAAAGALRARRRDPVGG